MKDSVVMRHWQAEAVHWYRMTAGAAAFTFGSILLAIGLFPMLVPLLVFFGGVATLASFGHAFLFSILLFRSQIRLLLHSIVAVGRSA